LSVVTFLGLSMIVMKFGGTSVEDASSIERVTEIIRARLFLKPVIVVSAMGKTTRKLLRAATASAAGDSRTCASLVIDLKARHKSEARRLCQNGREIFTRIDEYFGELGKLLEGLAILGDVPPRGLDKILSYGELISSAIVADALAARDIHAHLVDARELIKTNDCYGAAAPIFDITNHNIWTKVAPVLDRGEVPVIQGFIGSTRSGATTTLGFEGSDYSAAIVGAALEASDIQIWKDVSGLMTADPAMFAGARTVKLCSYAEAAELSYFGAKVLHPKAIYPAAQKNIPVHIYNSKRPEATGTAISAEVPACVNLIKSIAYKRPIKVLHAHAGQDQGGAGDLAPTDLIQSLLGACARQGVWPLITASSASSVVFAVDADSLGEERERDLLQQVSRFGHARVEADKAVISLVGRELYRDTCVAGRVFRAIEDLRPGIILHGTSPIVMNLVLAESQVANVIARLHEVFFEQIDPTIFE